MTEHECGTKFAYRAGCRCQPCRDANAAVARQFRGGGRRAIDRMGEGRYDDSFTYWDTENRSALMEARGYQLVDGTWVP